MSHYHVHITNCPITAASPEEAVRKALDTITNHRSGFFVKVTDREADLAPAGRIDFDKMADDFEVFENFLVDTIFDKESEDEQ